MFTSTLIVFRESLEAALMIGIIAAATKEIDNRMKWIIGGTLFGIIGSIVVAFLMQYIEKLANGNGEELFNIAVLSISITMIAWHNIWMSKHASEMIVSLKNFSKEVLDGKKELFTIALVIALSVLREGFETVMFLQGTLVEQKNNGNLIGSFLGLFLGFLVGIITYKGLIKIPTKRLFSITNYLLLFVAAGLAGQLAKYLIQADVISFMTNSVWDISNIISMDSILGNTLHIVLGYESAPNGLQLLLYFTTLILIFSATKITNKKVN